MISSYINDFANKAGFLLTGKKIRIHYQPRMSLITRIKILIRVISVIRGSHETPRFRGVHFPQTFAKRSRD
jgi:hypothetical protein